MTRLALLTEIPAPFRIPLFNALAQRVELRVSFLRGRQPSRRYRVDEAEMRFGWRVLPGFHLGGGSRWIVLNAGVARAVRSADVVLVGGWNQPAFWAALAASRRRGTPVLVWVESTLQDARPGAGAALKRLFARSAAAFVVPGRAAEAYVRSLVPDARVVTAPNAVDAALFASRTSDRDALRSDLRLERPAVLYVGRLAPEKGVDVLLAAARDLDAEVLVVGSGPEEGALRAAAPPNVRFLGQLDRDELPSLYAAADVLCLPSRSEPWGMTLNEGAAAALPLVATDAVGAAADLIEDGANGFRVPPGDVEALRGALGRLVRDPDLRAAAAERSRALGARFTPEAWADAVARVADDLARR